MVNGLFPKFLKIIFKIKPNIFGSQNKLFQIFIQSFFKHKSQSNLYKNQNKKCSSTIIFKQLFKYTKQVQSWQKQRPTLIKGIFSKFLKTIFKIKPNTFGSQRKKKKTSFQLFNFSCNHSSTKVQATFTKIKTKTTHQQLYSNNFSTLPSFAFINPSTKHILEKSYSKFLFSKNTKNNTSTNLKNSLNFLKNLKAKHAQRFTSIL